jgi:hypothetical protein
VVTSHNGDILSKALMMRIVGGWSIKLGPLGTAAIYCPIVPAPGDCEDGELFGGMKIGKGNRSTRRKPAPAPLCPPQIPLDQTRDRTRAAAVGNQRLTAYAMAQALTILFVIKIKHPCIYGLKVAVPVLIIYH